MRYSKNDNEVGKRTEFGTFANKFDSDDPSKTKNRVKQFLEGGKFNSIQNAPFKKQESVAPDFNATSQKIESRSKGT